MLANGGSTSLPIVHAVSREYEAFPGSRYALPADDEELQRLILQHNVLKGVFENKILLAPVQLDANGAVLEIGTGPGRWILDLADSVDSSIPMVAVDIQSRMFPASAPTNIDFRVESATHLPSEWTNKFSLVHQRLLMAALQIADWPVCLREIHRVLRPGGWVQLGEFTGWPAGKYPGKPCMEKLVAMYRAMGDARGLYTDCTQGIGKMLAEAGFVEIQSEARMTLVGKWAGEAGVANRINQIGVLRGMKTPILKAGGFGYVGSEEEFDRLLEGVEKEWDEIPGAQKEFVIFWARKPQV
ncbi:S-adenosyl-L-methionine-dependent methyltransferase [Mycena venus]|uniref:S-adenosyl-L-methionine-dependent methyltransferase n=1 Tax=Mycena venus TaxID=2733690 RepID=A0A8H7CCY0_9AGAR|nr:S-adenosyl-L-methionine-dependent methyltransferase [Mycena venus]